MELLNERWAEIKGWEGKYYISDHGRFKSLKGYRDTKSSEYITLGSCQPNFYPTVMLRDHGRKLTVRIHRLVAEYFLVKRAGDQCVNHKDGNKKNNHYSNLEWVTYKQNVNHAFNSGLINILGEKQHMAKLTKEKVIEMRQLFNDGVTQTAIGLKFGVDRRQVANVVYRKHWKHVL